jgi:hypothetical protein
MMNKKRFASAFLGGVAWPQSFQEANSLEEQKMPVGRWA